MRVENSRPEFQMNRFPKFSDWEEADFRDWLGQLRPGALEHRVIDRHDWQQVCVLQTVTKLTAHKSSSRILDVAAGLTLVPYLLAERAGTVVMTDLYDSHWSDEREGRLMRGRPTGTSSPSLTNPQRFRMDARQLGFRSDSFDLAYCIGPSVNWFGGREGVTEGMREMSRVVKPRGHVLISCETIVREDPPRFQPRGTKAHGDWVHRLTSSVRRASYGGKEPPVFFQRESVEAELTKGTGLNLMGSVPRPSQDLLDSPVAKGFLSHPPATPGRPKLVVRVKSAADLSLRFTEFAPLFLVFEKRA